MMKLLYFTYSPKGSGSILKWVACSLDWVGLYLLHRQKSSNSQFTRYNQGVYNFASVIRAVMAWWSDCFTYRL